MKVECASVRVRAFLRVYVFFFVVSERLRVVYRFGVQEVGGRPFFYLNLLVWFCVLFWAVSMRALRVAQSFDSEHLLYVYVHYA